jgi:hypothetical protein
MECWDGLGENGFLVANPICVVPVVRSWLGCSFGVLLVVQSFSGGAKGCSKLPAPGSLLLAPRAGHGLSRVVSRVDAQKRPVFIGLSRCHGSRPLEAISCSSSSSSSSSVQSPNPRFRNKSSVPYRVKPC